MKSLAAVLLVVALSVPATSQSICGVVTPNPVIAGMPATLTVTDVTGLGFQHQTNCLAPIIVLNTPNGPFAPLAVGLCGSTAVTVPPFGSATRTLSGAQSAILSGGRFYFRVGWRPVGTTGAYIFEWISFDVGSPSGATLTETTPAQVGQTQLVTLNAPILPSLPYLTAASFTTNVGINVGPGVFIGLDPDALFQLSFPTPLPGVFTNYQGATDLTGQAFLSLSIPNVPALARLPIKIQTAVVPVVGNPVLTNILNTCILP